MKTVFTFLAVAFIALGVYGKNGPLDHFGPILIDKANGLMI